MRVWPILCAVAVICGSPAAAQASPLAGHELRVVVSKTRPPAGTESLPVEWVRVAASDHGTLLAAVARPKGAGPFPAVVLLHGSHGFARQYVQLALDVARGGVIAVAACWFSGGVGLGMRFIDPLACPEAPPIPKASDPDALQSVGALLQAVRTLPDVRADRIGLIGHSRGGGAALNYALVTKDVQALVLSSTGYATELTGRAPELAAPVLILHGTADRPADGGSAMTDAQMARNFEAALRRAGRPVQVKFYDGGRHNGIFTSAAQYDDAVQRIREFLKSALVE